MSAGVALSLVIFTWLPKPVPADVVTIEEAPLTVTVDEDGRARVKDRYVVSVPISGRVVRVELRPGDEVEKGSVVARIVPVDPPLLDERSRRTAEARVAAAQAGRRQVSASQERAKAARKFADDQAKRLESLVDSGAVPRLDYDRAVYEARAAAAEEESLRFGIQVADHELQMARAALARLSATGKDDVQLEIPSPVDGRVLKVMQSSEGVVQAGTPLLEVGDPSVLEVVVDVLTRDAVSIETGARVTIDRWGGETLHGRVRVVEPSAFTRVSALGVEEQRVNVVIDLEDPRERWATLGDGYRVEARIEIWASDKTLVVPTSSAFRQGDGWAVYRLEDGHAKLTPIEIGQRNGRVVQVTSGLSAGDRVVVHPSDAVVDGVEVAPR